MCNSLFSSALALGVIVEASSFSSGARSVEVAYRVDATKVAERVSILATRRETSSLVWRIRSTAVVRFQIDDCAASEDALIVQEVNIVSQGGTSAL